MRTYDEAELVRDYLLNTKTSPTAAAKVFDLKPLAFRKLLGMVLIQRCEGCGIWKDTKDMLYEDGKYQEPGVYCSRVCRERARDAMLKGLIEALDGIDDRRDVNGKYK